MTKKKILWCGESSHLATGFGNYTREILSRLYDTRKYEIAELSCYRSPSVIKKEPWKIYPVIPRSDDPFKKIYDTQSLCAFGQVRFEFALLDFRPDIVIDVRDFWYLSYQNLSPLRKYFHWMIAPTYDSVPQLIDAMKTYDQADSLLFHSEWAMREFKKCCSGDNIKGVVNDAVDYNTFHPLDKSQIKKQYGIDDNHFIIGSVMRNQQRKLIPDIFAILKNLITKHNNLYLYLQTTYPENNSWDIPSLLLEYGVQNKVLFTYHCESCKNFCASVYQGINRKCRYCSNNSKLTSTNNTLNQNQLNTVYNLFDIYLQYSVCEGFGIPQVEAGAAGIPVITVDHGAMKEIGTKIGAEIIPIIKTFKDINGGTDRVYPNNRICVEILDQYIKMNRDDLIKIGQKTKELTISNYGWDITARKFEQVLDSIQLHGSKCDWADPSTLPNYIPKELPKIDNNRNFIYYIIDNVLNEPYLKKTYFIEEIICNLDAGYQIASNKQTRYSRDMALAVLQNWINNRFGLEKIRLNKEKLPSNLDYFLNYK